MTTITTSTNETIQFAETVGSANGKVVGNLWEKGDKCRIYFKVYFSDGSKADCGFFDVSEKKAYMSSNPVYLARAIEASIKF